MTIEMPSPIAAYFAADATGDTDLVTLCFTLDAEVMDEGQLHRGQDAIRTWKTETSGAYTYTVEPFSIEERDGSTIVTSRLKGNFPGSPVDLRYIFTIAGNRIAKLHIVPRV